MSCHVTSSSYHAWRQWLGQAVIEFQPIGDSARSHTAEDSTVFPVLPWFKPHRVVSRALVPLRCVCGASSPLTVLFLAVPSPTTTSPHALAVVP